MALYGYFKQGSDLFHDNAGTWENDDGRLTCNEQFLIDNGYMKLDAFKLKAANYEFPLNAIFALQKDTDRVYQYVADPTKFIDAAFVVNATYFDEVQYLSSYLT